MNDVGLVEHLHFCLSATEPSERRHARWVMNSEWYTECLGMRDSGGRRLWAPEPPRELLFGLPVEVRDDGGVPHLEPAHDGG